jgi:hypothetical protein
LVSHLREEKLRGVWNRVLMIIFEYKRDEVTGGLRKLQNEELHNFYFQPDVIRFDPIKDDKMGWSCIMHEGL